MPDAAPTNKAVLLVEDNEVEREGMAFILRHEGYTVATALDADGAVAFLRAHPETAVVLLDMLLPGKDGWRFLAERRTDPALAAVPVVITTAIRVASPEWARSLGAQAFFRKPVPVAAMLDEARCLGVA